MSIYSCPECGGKVSDEAISCPHCGKPNPVSQEMIAELKAQEAYQLEEERRLEEERKRQEVLKLELAQEKIQEGSQKQGFP